MQQKKLPLPMKFFALFLPLMFHLEIFGEEGKASQIDWLSFNDIYPCAKKGEDKRLQKKIIIDLYTDWCGWCKVLEKKTLNEPQVLAYLKKHFHMVRFNTEKDTEPICYKDFKNRYNSDNKEIVPFYLLDNLSYKYMKNANIHSFALFLTQNELTYPTLVILDESGDTFLKIQGYKDPEEFLNILRSVVNYDPSETH